MTATSPTDDGLHASITLHRSAVGRVGGDRIALLRAIRDSGSISGAARAIGLSYKSAWDAVQVLNNLFDQPLVLPSAGGSAGGASVITAAGEALIAAFEAAENELAGAMAKLEAGLSRADGASLKPLLWGVAMKTSARNVLRGTIRRVTAGEINAEVVLEVAEGVEIVATITRASADALGLVPGVAALALIKSSFILLARGEGELRTSARNCLAGTVLHREDDAVTSEVTLQLGLGKTITGTLTRTSADALDLHEGTRALALIKASHVILAVE